MPQGKISRDNWLSELKNKKIKMKEAYQKDKNSMKTHVVANILEKSTLYGFSANICRS